MPHDAKGRIVEPGDIVLMPFKVKQVHMSEDFCNCDLESMYVMPGNGSRTSLSAVNTRQVLRCRFGDDNESLVTVKSDGAVQVDFVEPAVPAEQA